MDHGADPVVDRDLFRHLFRQAVLVLVEIKIIPEMQFFLDFYGTVTLTLV
jgi:hypothetical protein